MDPRVTSTPAGRKELGLDEAEMIYDHHDLLYNPDDEDVTMDDEDSVVKPIDFTTQKSIVVGRELLELWHEDFFAGLSNEQIQRLMASCTAMQKQQLLAVARRVPCGVLPIVGSGGTGKTTVVIVLLMAVLERGKKPVVCSTTNAAVTNICKRAQMKNNADEYLFVRCHPEHEEHARIIGYRAQKTEVKPVDSTVKIDSTVEELPEETSLAHEMSRQRELPSSTGKHRLLGECSKLRASSRRRTQSLPR
ncbi:hypothetical protein ONS95_012314 [Cadophora gregata]|uniref:uncharacterized protein n=1 Tax=Cadophora gregata TaxID=51156 RepID=UPI0026DD0794|nr:uncharacterized protein ONS95_012314 [Cadophora gregata]KAK0118003.1 hypothetical protein ONS95_012314 [Cadophora gregata]KAK0123069.1 hypothetical protein ONS96_010077 [Cadophora gregata f. sp. sojae]